MNRTRWRRRISLETRILLIAIEEANHRPKWTSALEDINRKAHIGTSFLHSQVFRPPLPLSGGKYLPYLRNSKVMITTEPNLAIPVLVLMKHTHFPLRSTFLRHKLGGYCLTEEDLEGEGKQSRTMQSARRT